MNINKKGFTLIELLAVVVILGVIMLIALPSISNVITNSRRDSFIRTADLYIEGARNMAMSGTVDYEVNPERATVVSLNRVELEKGDEMAKSPFNQKWSTGTGESPQTFAYVVIINIRTQEDPKYAYYFTGKDALNNCMAMTKEGSGKRGDVKADGCGIVGLTSTNGTDVSITVGDKTFDGAHLNVYM